MSDSITFHHHLETSDTAQPKSSFCKLLGIDSECAPAMDFNLFILSNSQSLEEKAQW